jgi:hypothetical protein
MEFKSQIHKKSHFETIARAVRKSTVPEDRRGLTKSENVFENPNIKRILIMD